MEKSSEPGIKERSYRFALEIVKLTGSLSKNRAGRIIGDQVLRSGTSIGANIAESQAASSNKDFINFLNYALAVRREMS